MRRTAYLTDLAERLQTERGTVRNRVVDDAEAAIAVYGDPPVTRWLSPAMQRVDDVTAMRAVPSNQRAVATTKRLGMSWVGEPPDTTTCAYTSSGSAPAIWSVDPAWAATHRDLGAATASAGATRYRPPVSTDNQAAADRRETECFSFERCCSG